MKKIFLILGLLMAVAIGCEKTEITSDCQVQNVMPVNPGGFYDCMCLRPDCHFGCCSMNYYSVCPRCGAGQPEFIIWYVESCDCGK